jgi:hypothetical protein
MASVITRWGKQWGLLHSAFRNAQALRHFVVDPRSSFKKPQFMAIIADQNFWIRLENLLMILKPLHEAQKMSESGKSFISLVGGRWLQAQEEMRAVRHIYEPFAEEVNHYLNTTFQARMNLQLTSLHWLAHFLLPENYDKPIDPWEMGFIRLFEHYIPNAAEAAKAVDSFYQFRLRTGPFIAAAAWSYKDDYYRFWLRQVSKINDCYAYYTNSHQI